MSRSGGFSKARLARASGVMRGYVDRGAVAGVVSLVCRHDEVHVEALGAQDRGTAAPMRRDTIFRIASMTTPVAAAAAMILVEEAKLRLDEPIERFIPELASRRVLRTMDSPLDDTVQANRPITLRDLLTFRLGFGAVMAPPGRYPIQRAAAQAGFAPGPDPSPYGPDEWIRRFAALPLMHQPGEKWMYHTGSDILGVLIARAADMPLEAFLAERIFAPLGMKDTGSASRRQIWTAWRPAIRSMLRAESSRSSTKRARAAGPSRPASHPAEGGWSRPSTTIWRSAE